MGDDKNLIFGIVIGAIIVLIFMGKPKTQTAGPNNDAKKLLGGWRRLKRIPNTERIISGMEIATELPSTYYEKMVPAEQAINTDSFPQATIECQETRAGTERRGIGYNNDEKWLVKRGSDGRISGYEIIRKANISK